MLLMAAVSAATASPLPCGDNNSKSVHSIVMKLTTVLIGIKGRSNSIGAK